MVTALVTDLIMPIIGMAVPGGEWRTISFQIGTGKFLVGDFIGAVVDFVIIAVVVFIIGKALVKPVAYAGHQDLRRVPGGHRREREEVQVLLLGGVEPVSSFSFLLSRKTNRPVVIERVREDCLGF